MAKPLWDGNGEFPSAYRCCRACCTMSLYIGTSRRLIGTCAPIYRHGMGNKLKPVRVQAPQKLNAQSKTAKYTAMPFRSALAFIKAATHKTLVGFDTINVFMVTSFH